MNGQAKANSKLIDENSALRKRISDLEQMEDCLRPSEEKYRTILESIEDGYFEQDLVGNFIFLNESMSRIYGYPKDELIGMNYKQHTDEENGKKCIQAYMHIYRTGEPGKVVDFEIIRKDGTKRCIESSVSLKKDSVGKPVAFMGIIRDITERKQVEDALKKSQGMLRVISENMSDMIRVTDLQGNNLYVSPSHFKGLGYTIEERVGKSGLDIVHADDVEIIMNKFAEGLLTKQPMKAEYRVKHAEGHCVWLDTVADFLRDDQGEAIAVVLSSRDISDRKLAESQREATLEALRESEEKFRVLAESTPTAIMFYQDDRWIYLNKAAEMISGYSEKELLEMNFWDLVHPDFKTSIEKEGRKRQRGEPTTNRHELKIIAKDGTVSWVDLSGASTMLQGRLAGILSIIDITDRKKAETALLESEIKFKSYAEQALVGIYLLQDGVFKYVNPKFAQLFDYTVEECLNDMPFENLIHEEDLVNVKEQVRKRISGEVEFVHYTFRGMKKNGQILHVEIYGSSSVHKGKPAAAGAILDITESKRTQEALHESEKHYRLLAENATDVIWTVNMDMQLTYVSPSVSKLLGFTAEEAMARTIQQVYTPSSFEKAMQIFADEMEIESSGHGDPARSRILELELVCKDGNTIPVEGNFCFLRDQTDKTIGILASVRDITDRKRAEEERHHYEKLQGVLETAGAICHEMNQPMQIISGYSEMLLMNTSDNDPIREKLDAISKQIHRMGNITKKLMTIEDFDTQDYAGFSRIINIHKRPGNDTE